MKINAITRVLAFAALTSASHYALAAGGSQDYVATMTVAAHSCPMEITASNTNFGFTYTYTQADADNDTLGTMTQDSGPASVKVSVPDSCEIGPVNFQVALGAGTVKIAKNMAGITTNNGGVFPYFIGYSNINFYTDSAATAGKAYAVNADTNPGYVTTSTDDSGNGQLQYGLVNGNSKYGTENNGYPLLVSSGGVHGYMRMNGSANSEPGSSYGRAFTTGGIYKIANQNDSPLEPDGRVNTSGDAFNTWYPSTGPGETTRSTAHYSSVVASFVAAVSLYPYSLADATPDPHTVYDTQGNADPITSAATLTITKL